MNRDDQILCSFYIWKLLAKVHGEAVLLTLSVKNERIFFCQRVIDRQINEWNSTEGLTFAKNFIYCGQREPSATL